MFARLLGISNWEELAQDANFDPGKMADLCLISLRQMERFFAQNFHKTPREWVRELQCQFAKTLIAQGFSTKAVAAELRFASETHFCHSFKRVFGVPPQTFAPRYRGSSTPPTARAHQRAFAMSG